MQCWRLNEWKKCKLLFIGNSCMPICLSFDLFWTFAWLSYFASTFCFFYCRQDIYMICLQVTYEVYYSKQELLTLREYLGVTLFLLMESVLLILSFLVLCFLCLSSLCVLCPMLPVSLDSPFLTAFFGVFCSNVNFSNQR